MKNSSTSSESSETLPYDLVNTGLGDLGTLETGVSSLARFHAHLLELGTRDRGVEVNSLMKRIDLDERGRGAGKSSLGSLTSSTKTSQSTGILREILSSGFLLLVKYLCSSVGLVSE